MSTNTISPQQKSQSYEAGSLTKPTSQIASIEKANTSAPSISSAQEQNSREGFIGKVMEGETAVSYNRLKLIIKFVNSSGSLPQNGQQASGTYQTAPNGSAQCTGPVGNAAEAKNPNALSQILEVIGNLIDLIKDLLMKKQKPTGGGATAGDGKPTDGTNGTGQAGPIGGAPETNNQLNEMLTQLIKLLQNILPLIQEELEKSNQNGSANGQAGNSIVAQK